MYGEVAAGVAVVAQGSVRVQGEVGDGFAIVIFFLCAQRSKHA